MKKITLPLITLVLMSAGAHGATIFSDNYNAGSGDNINSGYDTTGRQTGLLSPLTYTQEAPDGTFTHQLDNGGGTGDSNPLLLAAETGPGAKVSPDADFNIAAPLLQISLQINPNAGGGPDGNGADQTSFLGIAFGSNTQNPSGAAVNATGGLGFLLRGNGGHQAFNDGTLVTSLSATSAGGAGQYNNIIIDLTAVDGISSFDGNGSIVTISENGTLLYSFAADPTDNYVSLVALSDGGGLSVSYVDNLSITAGPVVAAPEPSTVVFVIGGLALLVVLGRQRQLNA